MKKQKGVLVTTAVDRHGDRYTVGALRAMVDQINSKWIPFGVEHDPRIPPQGRVESAELKQREDGEYCVEGVIELFERNDPPSEVDDSREMPFRDVPPGQFELYYDRTFRDEDSMHNVERVAAKLGVEAKQEHKKAADPISVLLISAGAAATMAFAKSFGETLGKAAADGVTKGLKNLFSGPARRGQGDNLLVISYCCHTDHRVVEIQVILSNPSEATIDAYFDRGVKELERIAQGHLKTSARIRRIVYEFVGENIEYRYAVRTDARPVYPDSK